MTDRELLEYAAKAAGIRLLWSTEEGVSPRRDTTWDDWKPLTDDGDALRLAVKLGLNIMQQADYNIPWVDVVGPKSGAFGDYKGDPYAATRRAIVSAAAALGKAMP